MYQREKFIVLFILCTFETDKLSFMGEKAYLFYSTFLIIEVKLNKNMQLIKSNPDTSIIKVNSHFQRVSAFQVLTSVSQQGNESAVSNKKGLIYIGFIREMNPLELQFLCKYLIFAWHGRLNKNAFLVYNTVKNINGVQ